MPIEEQIELNGCLFFGQMKHIDGLLVVASGLRGVEGERFAEALVEKHLSPLPESDKEGCAEAAAEGARCLKEDENLRGGAWGTAVEGEAKEGNQE